MFVLVVDTWLITYDSTFTYCTFWHFYIITSLWWIRWWQNTHSTAELFWLPLKLLFIKFLEDLCLLNLINVALQALLLQPSKSNACCYTKPAETLRLPFQLDLSGCVTWNMWQASHETCDKRHMKHVTSVTWNMLQVPAQYHMARSNVTAQSYMWQTYIQNANNWQRLPFDHKKNGEKNYNTNFITKVLKLRPKNIRNKTAVQSSWFFILPSVLLAPPGALIVMMCYCIYIYIYIQPLFQIFTQSSDAIDVTSVTLSRLN